jgi:hypothetical protein
MKEDLAKTRDPKQNAKHDTKHDGKHDGTVVSATADGLTTTCSQGKHHHHMLAKDARVTCDGKASKIADLKAGTHVRVTTHVDDKNVATAVESGKHIAAPSHKA